jgi:hypothetical protein
VSAPELTVRIASSVGAFDRNEWNALGGIDNPFVSHEFLTAMEDSGSVGPGTGWEPAPIAITGEAGKLLAAMPSYAKGHWGRHRLRPGPGQQGSTLVPECASPPVATLGRPFRLSSSGAAG